MLIYCIYRLFVLVIFTLRFSWTLALIYLKKLFFLFSFFFFLMFHRFKLSVCGFTPDITIQLNRQNQHLFVFTEIKSKRKMK